MELLKQLLASEKITVPNLEAEVKALGFDPDNISDDDALKIVDKLKQQHNSKISKTGKKPSTIPTPSTPNLEAATEKAVKQVDAMVSQYQQLADKVVDAKSAKIIAIIEEIPNATMARVRQLLDDTEGNLDFFLTPIDDVQTNFLSKFGIE